MKLNDMYHTRFNLEYNPFIKNNSDKYYFESNDVKEANYKMDYLFKTKGIGIISGYPGCGKTTFIRKYIEHLNKALYKVVYISMTTLTDMEFYKALIKAFGYEPSYRKIDNYTMLQKIILDYENKKITPVIIIDEANYMTRTMLNDLKMIFNFYIDSKDNYILILCGLPVLLSNLNTAQQEPLRQRIITSIAYEGLDENEIRPYIFGKLEAAGGTSNIFEDGSIQAVINQCNGRPRIIDRILDYSLLISDSKQSSIITKEIIQKAVEQTII